MNIYFIRHGDPDYANDSITEKGKVQAEKLAEYLKDWKVDEVYQSPMGRAKQTATYVSSKWNKEPVTLDWLSEIVWGKKGGKPYDSLSPWQLVDAFIEKNQTYPLDESWKELPEFKENILLSDMEERIKSFDGFLKEQGYERKNNLYTVNVPNDKNIVFVCHGGISTVLMSHLLNIPFFQFTAHIGLGVTSFSKLRISGEKGEVVQAKLDLLNDRCHLN